MHIYKSVDVYPLKRIIVYCNTGLRSAHAYVALRLLNSATIRNHVESWQEWGNKEMLPINTDGA